MAVILAYPAASWTTVSAAAATMLITLVAAFVTGHAMKIAEQRLDARSGGLDAPGHTRLRFLRRLVFSGIILTGVFLALLQFDSFDRLASAAIASGALISAIVGFAARDSLSNAVSGVTLALSQPIRVGDVIQVGDVRGVVEDVTLMSTWVRTADQGRVILPNTLVTTTAVRNDSIKSPTVIPSAALWIDPGADTRAALTALTSADGIDEASVEETTPEGIRLRAAGSPVPAGERAQAESALRATGLAALHGAGVRDERAG